MLKFFNNNVVNNNFIWKNSINNNKQQKVRLAFMKVFDIVFYPTMSSLSYLWGFGSLAGLMLAMHFQPYASMAFESVLFNLFNFTAYNDNIDQVEKEAQDNNIEKIVPISEQNNIMNFFYEHPYVTFGILGLLGCVLIYCIGFGGKGGGSNVPLDQPLIPNNNIPLDINSNLINISDNINVASDLSEVVPSVSSSIVQNTIETVSSIAQMEPSLIVPAAVTVASGVVLSSCSEAMNTSVPLDVVNLLNNVKLVEHPFFQKLITDYIENSDYIWINDFKNYINGVEFKYNFLKYYFSIHLEAGVPIKDAADLLAKLLDQNEDLLNSVPFDELMGIKVDMFVDCINMYYTKHEATAEVFPATIESIICDIFFANDDVNLVKLEDLANRFYEAKDSEESSEAVLNY